MNESQEGEKKKPWATEHTEESDIWIMKLSNLEFKVI